MGKEGLLDEKEKLGQSHGKKTYNANLFAVRTGLTLKKVGPCCERETT